MFDTNIVIIGNVLTAPEWRRVSSNSQLVANFRIASTARRYDRETGTWTDGNSFRVRVTAWRKLAEGVASSIRVGDPVIVYGRIYTRDWTDDDKRPRIAYEMEAHSIGHDLSRGRGRFYRNTALATLSVVEGPDDDAMVGGEPSEPLAEREVPVAYGEGLPEQLGDEGAPGFLEVLPGGLDEPAAEEPGQTEEPAPMETRRSRRGAGRKEPVPA